MVIVLKWPFLAWAVKIDRERRKEGSWPVSQSTSESVR